MMLDTDTAICYALTERLAQPLGGYSSKGRGQDRLGGKCTILEMTQIKAIVIDIENVRRE